MCCFLPVTRRTAGVFLVAIATGFCLWLEFYFHLGRGYTEVYPSFFFIPVISASLLLGLRGGLIAGLVLAGVHNVLEFDLSLNFVLRGVAMITAGAVSGYMADRMGWTRGQKLPDPVSSDLLEKAPVSVSVVDAGGRFLYWNRETLDMYGYEPGELQNITISSIEDRSEDDITKGGANLPGPGGISYDTPCLRKDGSVFPAKVFCRPVEWKGQPAVLRVASEMTGQRMAEEAIFFEKERFRTTLLSIGDGVISTDSCRRILLMNRVAEDITGWKNAEARGQVLEKVLNVVHEDTSEMCEMLHFGQESSCQGKAVLLARDGRKVPVESSLAPVSDMAGGSTGLVVVFRDCSEKRERQRRIEYLSYHDELTGLHNRRFFDEELRRLDLPRNLPLSLVVVDVNGLKLFNDAFGHLAGDDLLKRVSEVLKGQCRPEDVLARLGGDEFIMILPGSDPAVACQMASGIGNSMSMEEVEGVPLSVSCGWGTKFDMDTGIRKVFEMAEDHMYRNKISQKTVHDQRSVRIILETLFSRMPGERAHSQNVGRLCERVGHALGLCQSEIGELKTAGIIHDIGKIGISRFTIRKKGDFSAAEWAEIMKHPETGFSILSSANEYSRFADAVLSHHEKWDGSGYPRGLKGEEIPLFARVISIAEAYDTMVSGRNWKMAVSPEAAVDELRRCSGTQFSPELVPIFIREAVGQS